MPQIALSAALAIAFFCTVIYLHAVFQLHRLIAVERPEWVNVRGPLDFFYTGFLPAANPSVGSQVLKSLSALGLGNCSPLWRRGS